MDVLQYLNEKKYTAYTRSTNTVTPVSATAEPPQGDGGGSSPCQRHDFVGY